MDTLKRVGSLRLSKRGRKNRDPHQIADKDVDVNSSGGALMPEPRFYATLGRKEKQAKAFFTISFKDALVSTLNGFQPTHLKVIFERHRLLKTSNPVLWEPSLKCTSTGSGVWHPPFIIHVAITVPKLSKASNSDTLRHKDAFVSIENTDLKGKKKLLAKARLNLSDYFESAAENDVSFRLKLHPESSKIASSSIDLTLRKSTQDPTKQCSDAFSYLCGDETRSLGDERILNASLHSLGSSPCSSSKSREGLAAEAIAPIATVEDSKIEDDDNTVVATTPKASPVVPAATPPPLPPRQKPISTETPVPPSQDKTAITSTPLPKFSPPAPSVKITKPEEKISEEEFTKPVVVVLAPSQPAPVAKEIDWSNEKEEAEPEHPQSMGIDLSACASPKVTKPSERSHASAEKDLMEWAKTLLANRRPRVKVTNLTSSWRNGLGFCQIIESMRPKLIPSDLSSENARDNNELSFDASDLLGLNTEAIRKMALEEEVTHKAVVVEFLRQLRIFKETDDDAEPPVTVIEFQKKWYRRAKHFKKEVGHICKMEDEEEKRIEEEKRKEEEKRREEEKRKEEEKAKEEEEKAKVIEDMTADSNGLSEKPIESEECDRNSPNDDKKPPLTQREKVRRLITLAHESSSYEEEEASLSTPSNSEALGQSGTILEELSQLAQEEDQICAELEKMDQAIRQQDPEEADSSDFEAMLQKYFSLVNEKNSVVRRQMQLNIAEKERALEHKKEKLQLQLQKFSDLDESRKTEAMRLEEESLLQQYVEAVNEKNELVHDLDSQEKMIAEDERIRSFIANRDSLMAKAAAASSGGPSKHNIMDEFLDFFKTSSVDSKK